MHATTISLLVEDESADWERAAPADPSSLDKLMHDSGLELPDDYLDFLRHSNGGSGRLAIEPGWFEVWPAEDVLSLHQDYATDEFIPGFWGFGSSGGGELLAFEINHSKGRPWPVVMIPFVPMSVEQAVVIAEDFTALVRGMGRHPEDH